jgi:hypothetical protein
MNSLQDLWTVALIFLVAAKIQHFYSSVTETYMHLVLLQFLDQLYTTCKALVELVTFSISAALRLCMLRSCTAMNSEVNAAV